MQDSGRLSAEQIEEKIKSADLIETGLSDNPEHDAEIFALSGVADEKEMIEIFEKDQKNNESKKTESRENAGKDKETKESDEQKAEKKGLDPRSHKLTPENIEYYFRKEDPIRVKITRTSREVDEGWFATGSDGKDVVVMKDIGHGKLSRIVVPLEELKELNSFFNSSGEVAEIPENNADSRESKKGVDMKETLKMEESIEETKENDEQKAESLRNEIEESETFKEFGVSFDDEKKEDKKVISEEDTEKEIKKLEKEKRIKEIKESLEDEFANERDSSDSVGKIKPTEGLGVEKNKEIAGYLTEGNYDGLLQIISQEQDKQMASEVILNSMFEFNKGGRTESVKKLTTTALDNVKQYGVALKELILYTWRNNLQGERFWENPNKDEILFVDDDGELISFQGELDTITQGKNKGMDYVKTLGEYEVLTGPNTGKKFDGSYKEGRRNNPSYRPIKELEVEK